MSYCICYFHYVWATKNRQPWLVPANTNTVFRVIRAKSAELSCRVVTINCVTDHIHVAVRLHSSISVARWAKEVKGASSYRVNQDHVDLPFHFRWQDGYAALTFGAKSLPFVVAYIENQAIHHAQATVIPYLENTGDSDEDIPRVHIDQAQR